MKEPMGWEDMNAPCPRRQPGLTHVLDHRVRVDGRCIFCNVPVGRREPPENIDVDARLHALGLDKPLEFNRDNVMVEPKMATGVPDGPSWGRGRGELSIRDKRRLTFACFHARDGIS